MEDNRENVRVIYKGIQLIREISTQKIVKQKKHTANCFKEIQKNTLNSKSMGDNKEIFEVI